MKLDRKTLMGLAAVVGVVGLIYLRKGSAASTASTGGVQTSIPGWVSGDTGQSSSPTVLVLTHPLQANDATASSAAPTNTSPTPSAPAPTFGNSAPTTPVPLNDGSNPSDPGRNTAEQQAATNAFLSHPFF